MYYFFIIFTTLPLFGSGVKAMADCTACDPGRYCNGAALTEPNGICEKGYFCRSGAKTGRPADGGATGDPCPKGNYCPAGTGAYDLLLVWVLISVCH